MLKILKRSGVRLCSLHCDEDWHIAGLEILAWYESSLPRHIGFMKRMQACTTPLLWAFWFRSNPGARVLAQYTFGLWSLSETKRQCQQIIHSVSSRDSARNIGKPEDLNPELQRVLHDNLARILWLPMHEENKRLKQTETKLCSKD